ncbi:MAG: Pycsar system effector family protein [Myxococcales bacterium]
MSHTPPTQADANALPRSIDLPVIAEHPVDKFLVAPAASLDANAVPDVAPSADGHLKLAEEIHQYVREYIRNADQKATFAFAAATAGLAFLNGRGGVSRWFKAPDTWTLIDGLAFAAMAGLAVAAAVLLAVVLPRLKRSGPGIVFFNSIAEHKSASEYAAEVVRHTPGDVVDIKLHHAYDLAKVCRAKYRTLVVGFWIGGIGAMATLLYLLLVRMG